MNNRKMKDLFCIKKGKKEELADGFDEKCYRYIQIDDLRNDSTMKYCKDRAGNVKVTESDIIIAWDGANAGTIGYGLNGVIGSTLAKLEPVTNGFYTPYIGLYLQSKFEYLRGQCTGATIPHISRDALESLEIPLPALPIQMKIVEVLDKAQELIDMRKKQLGLLDELVQSVFYEMFGDPVTNPKGWKKVRLEKVCDICRGGSPRPISEFLGGTIPWIKIGDATKGDDIYISHTSEHIHESGVSKSRLIKKGSLIFANCGVSLGFARIIEFDGCIHDGWLSFEIIDPEVNKLFLLKLLNCYTDFFRSSAPDGTQPNLNTSIMKAFEVIVPPLIIQEEFARTLVQINQEKSLMQSSLTEMGNTFNSLMQQAFSGELF